MASETKNKQKKKHFGEFYKKWPLASQALLFMEMRMKPIEETIICNNKLQGHEIYFPLQAASISRESQTPIGLLKFIFSS